MTPYDAIGLFLGLVALHALCDYPLQGDFLATAKNRWAGIPGVPWWQAMGAHAAIHGGAVGWATGIWWLGLFEAVMHALIDHAKCRGILTFNRDQALHIVLKLGWVFIWLVVSQ